MKNKKVSKNIVVLKPPLHFFMTTTDPRVYRRSDHPLATILMIAICAVISGAESFVDMEDFGNAKKDWLGSFLDMSNGVPSHGTFG